MAEWADMSFGELLRTLRTEAGLTQEELAESARVSYRSVSDLERGVNRTARKETARLLAQALQLTDTERAAFVAAARGIQLSDFRHTSGANADKIVAPTRTLPRDAASFTGREHELAFLVAAVTDAAPRVGVVSICAIGGMAGIGKTALAVHAAHQLAARFPDGQIFLPLHGHTPGRRPVEPGDALASLLETAGIAAQHIPAGVEARARLWRDHLAGRQLLLVLDDASGHEQVRPLLPGEAGCLVLITSRKHLTALEDARVVSLDTLAPRDAADLLVQLAARKGVHADDQAVLEITRLCGYLPLAVGMLARQLHHHPAWSPEDLAADLAVTRDRLRLMSTENISVAAAFDLSYQDLTAGQQQVFRRLGLHPGTDLDAYATAALDDSDIDPARSDLAVLYDHYLIAEPSRGRYRMHDLIAEHARALALTDPAGDREAAVDRLLRYYLDNTRAASAWLARRTPESRYADEPAVSGPGPDLSDPRDAAAWMAAERANLYAAAGYAADHGRSGLATALPSAMHGYLRNHGQWDQDLNLYHRALALARRAADWQAEAIALTDIGDILHLQGNYQQAAETLTQALQIFRDHGNQPGEANALQILGSVGHDTGKTRAAADSLNAALRIYRSIGDWYGESGSLAYLGGVQIITGDYAGAIAGLTRGLELQREAGNRLGEAGLLNFLGRAQHAAGYYADAAANHALALKIQREVGSQLEEVSAMNGVGLSHQLAGDYGAAADCFNGALAINRRLRRRIGEAKALHYLGTLHCLTDDLESAAVELESALALYRALGVPVGEAEVLNSMGVMLLRMNDPGAALTRHEQALAIAKGTGALPEEGRALEGIGRCELRAGRAASAGRSLRSALAIYRRIGSPDARRVLDLLPPGTPTTGQSREPSVPEV